MIAMKPIAEPQLLDELAAGRFDGPVEGYVVMEGPKYHGYALYKIDGALVTVLDCNVEDLFFLDGAVRACISAGEFRGAQRFAVHTACEPLVAWWQRL